MCGDYVIFYTYQWRTLVYVHMVIMFIRRERRHRIFFTIHFTCIDIILNFLSGLQIRNKYERTYTVAWKSHKITPVRWTPNIVGGPENLLNGSRPRKSFETPSVKIVAKRVMKIRKRKQRLRSRTLHARVR